MMFRRPVAILFLSLLCSTAVSEPTERLLVAGDFPITANAARLELQNLPTTERLAVLADEGRFRELINTMYRREKLASVARSEQLDEDPKVKHEMQRRADEALIDELVRRFKISISVPNFEQLAKERYLANKADYVRPERLHLRHILVKSSTPDARRKIDDALGRIREGDEFESVALAVSEDGSAQMGGDLGWVVKGQTVQRFERAAFALQEPGAVSEPVETQFGWHIIQLVEREPAEQLTYEQAKATIIPQIESQYRKDAYVAWYRDVTDFSGAQANDDVIEAVLEELRNEGRQ